MGPLDEDERWGAAMLIAVVVIGAVLFLGAAKVGNEYRMTNMYERQAVALESIAYSLAGARVEPKDLFPSTEHEQSRLQKLWQSRNAQ